MRATFSVLYLILIIALLGCAFFAHRSDKPSRDAVALLEIALIPPVLGNLLIVGTSFRIPALIGCYFYYLGMDLVMFALVNFTNVYCRGSERHKKEPLIVYMFLAADALQMLLNPLTGHAFAVSTVDVEGFAYYKLIPYFGQTVHRVIDYIVFFCVVLMFIVTALKTPKIYRERYAVILATMIAVGLVQTYNIFFQYAIDRSMLGYGVFGVVIFFFAIHYRPLRLLDRVLSNIVSGLSDAFYIFDPNGRCLWANEQGCRLAGADDKHFEEITGRLRELFGETGSAAGNTAKRMVGEGENARFYVLEEQQVTDDNGHVDGSYLRIQDVTEGEQELKARDEQIGQIRQAAYRDPLTGVGSKAAYSKKVSELNAQLAEGDLDFAVVMVDMNNLKGINDAHGHKAGDLYIRGCCHLICEAFKHSPVFRIGGDEFVAILQGQDYENRDAIADALSDAFVDAFLQTDREPWLRYSAAVGMAVRTKDDSSFETVFKRADLLMYAEKNAFKKLHGSSR